VGALAGGIITAFIGGLICCALLLRAFPQFVFHQAEVQEADGITSLNIPESNRDTFRGSLHKPLGGRLRSNATEQS
jgi:hypothetical protein